MMQPGGLTAESRICVELPETRPRNSTSGIVVMVFVGSSEGLFSQSGSSQVGWMSDVA
jgi:hypothetical protein